MFCIGRDGEVYNCDSFKSFKLETNQKAIGLYTMAPIPGIHNMFMRFWPKNLRDQKEGEEFVPNVEIPGTRYTLSLSSDNDIPVFLRNVFQIMTYEDANLPKNLPQWISDVLYIENLPKIISDIQRFMYSYGFEDSIEILDAEFPHPSGCELRNPFQIQTGYYPKPTEKLGPFYRFIPVSFDGLSLPGLGYIVQEDMYQYIQNLNGNWAINIFVESDDDPNEISQKIEICGWNCGNDFFDMAYFTSITCSILNRLKPHTKYSAASVFYRSIPASVDIPDHVALWRYYSPKDPRDVDVCMDAFIRLRTNRLIR